MENVREHVGVVEKLKLIEPEQVELVLVVWLCVNVTLPLVLRLKDWSLLKDEEAEQLVDVDGEQERELDLVRDPD